MMQKDVVGKKPNLMVVESMFQGLVGEAKSVDQLPCLVSADQTKMFVWFCDLPVKKFTKPVLFNLVQTAENVSPACQKLVFILQRESDSYEEFKQMLSVIDAERMTKSQIGQEVKE